ncbi:MAG: exo-alpha-sialidase [Thermoleophilia bacterium]|nr:exo-alpha-sialidase [Thermoleophilia bacterium]
MRVRMLVSVIATVVAAGLVATGCGSDPDDSKESGSGKATSSKAPSITFGESTMVAAGGSDPDLAFTPDGTVLLSWVEPVGGAHAMGGHDMEGSEHSDGDDHASEDAVDRGGSDTVMVDHGDEPAADEHSGEEMAATTFDLYVARSTDGGETFGDKVKVNAIPGDIYSGANTQPKVLAVDDERVLVSWTNNSPYPGQDYGKYTVRVAESIDGGATFGKPRDLLSKSVEGEVSSESYQELHALEDGSIVAAFLDYRGTFRTPSDDGIGVRTATWKSGQDWFGKSVQVDEASCECCDNAFAVNAKGELLLAFRDQVAGKGDDKPVRDSSVRMSDDQGATWSDVTKLGDDDWEFDQCPESGPDLGVDGKGTVHGVYYTGKPGRPGVYHSWSDDDGVTFESAKLATDEKFFPGSYMDLATLDAGAVIAWDDSREDDAKVGYAVVGEDGSVSAKPGLATGKHPSVAALDGHVLLAWVSEKGVELASSGEHAHDGAADADAETSSGSPDDDVDASFDVAIKDGAVTGGPQVFKVEKGDSVRISISSDAADEVHVHGVDVSRDIPADGTATVTFEADTQGSFEVELHEAGTLLGTLEVR